MIAPPTPPDEQKRQKAVERLNILNTPPEERFDSITKEAAKRLHAPISTISIIDKSREWFKSCYGLKQKEGLRNISFCGHSMLAKEVFIVEDTLLDERFADNPYVVGEPFLRFYAGVSLHDKKTGLPVGVLCIKDTKPRKFSSEDTATLIELAEQAEQELNAKPQ